jgi:uncharacterized membrane protein
MTGDFLTIINIVFNLAVTVAIIVGISRALQIFKKFVDTNRKIEEKIDIILDKLENKEDN